MQSKVLCSISTRGRTDTTLPLAIESIINQTKKVDRLVIFDDNDDQKDLRSTVIYANLFKIMDMKNIAWEWLFAGKKGQHHNHQIANTMGYEWVWRMDDDTIAEPTVLESLWSYVDDTVGGVGGAILTPSWDCTARNATGKIEDIDSESNIQWGIIDKLHEVDHLHCSFLYRAGIHDYNTNLSRVAHREETLFSYGLKQKGYKLLVVPDTITWHLKSPDGGIRSEDNAELYYHDEQIFRNIIDIKDKTIVVLNCGMGDHVVFKRVIKDIKNPVVFTCYPDIVPGRSIAEAEYLYGNLDQYNIYSKMDQWQWTDSLENAFRKMYIK
jgi:hypothetical protein